MRVEVSLGFVVSLRPKGAAFGQAGSTRLDYFYRMQRRGIQNMMYDVRCTTGLDFTQIHHERERAGDSGQFSLYNTRCTWKGGFPEDVLRAGFA